MTAALRHTLRWLFACAAIAPASAYASNAIDSAYRAWLTGRARAAESLAEPRDAVAAAALWQHLCGTDAKCFPDAAWRALDERARRSDDPALLTVAANVASQRVGVTDLSSRWARIAALDPDNAYPMIMQAGAEWHAGSHDAALDLLSAAVKRPRVDDRFSATFALLRPIIDAEPPSLSQLHPCALADRNPNDGPPSVAELRGTVLFEIASGVGFPAQFGYLMSVCKDIPAEQTARHAACQTIGAHMAEHATSQLSRSFGLALQRLSSTEAAQQDIFAERQRSALDELHRKLWWVQRAPEPAQRAAATDYWLDQIARRGEVGAADALIARYGEPPPESREERERFYEREMQQGQACYARIRHER